MMISHPLSWILALPTLALACLFLVPGQNTVLIRRISYLGVLSPFLLSLWVFFSYNHIIGGFQFVENIPWVVPFGISYHLGIDGINAVLVVLLGFGSLTGVMISQNIKERLK